MRVASELRETLAVLLQAASPEAPAVRNLIDTYRDIARELGQQHDVERALHDLFAAHTPYGAARSAPHPLPPAKMRSASTR